jgi:aryl-alcohol dehydrogenase-like predicted oxidoreductase
VQAGDRRAGRRVWSPLASGFLTGKYTRADYGVVGDGRIAAFGGSVRGRPYGEREWRILDVLREVAGQLGRTPAEVALAWVTNRRGVSSTLIGARNAQQLDANMRALGVELPLEATARLDAASEPEPAFPYQLFTGELGRSFAHGGASVRRC